MSDGFLAGFERFKAGVGWTRTGYCADWPGGPRTVQGIRAEYLRRLLELEEVARYIAERGTGPVSTALARKLTELGLLKNAK